MNLASHVNSSNEQKCTRFFYFRCSLIWENLQWEGVQTAARWWAPSKRAAKGFFCTQFLLNNTLYPYMFTAVWSFSLKCSTLCSLCTRHSLLTCKPCSDYRSESGWQLVQKKEVDKCDMGVARLCFTSLWGVNEKRSGHMISREDPVLCQSRHVRCEEPRCHGNRDSCALGGLTAAFSLVQFLAQQGASLWMPYSKRGCSDAHFSVFPALNIRCLNAPC